MAGRIKFLTQFIRNDLGFRFECRFGGQTKVVVGGQINQIVFVQSIEPLQPPRTFHLTEQIQRAVFGITLIHRAELDKGPEVGPEFVF